MNRYTAEQLTVAVKKIDAAIGEIHDLVASLDDETQKKEIRRTIAGVIIDLYAGITREIAREYPDLHPDRAEIDAERQARERKPQTQEE